MCYYYINSLHAALHIKHCCDITLKPLWAILRHPCNVCFSFLSLLFLPLSLSPLVSWIDFPFVLDSRDAQCWFQLYGGCFIACSMFVYGGIPQFHSAHKSIPSGRAYPRVPSAPPPSQRWTRQTSDLLPKHTSVSTFAQMHVHTEPHVQMHSCIHKHSDTYMLNTLAQTHIHATNHHLHTQYLLLYHIAVNPVKKLCGQRK